MKIDGRSHPNGKSHNDGTQAETKGTDYARQNASLCHRFHRGLGQECPGYGPPPSRNQEIENNEQGDSVDSSREPEKSKHESLHESPATLYPALAGDLFLLITFHLDERQGTGRSIYNS